MRQILLLAAVLLVMALPANAVDTVRVVADWDYLPYTFRNSNGEADGMLIDIIEEVLKEAEVPYRIEMFRWSVAKQTFADGHKNDIMIDMAEQFAPGSCYTSITPVAYYLSMAVAQKGKPRIKTPKDIPAGTKVALITQDFVDVELRKDSVPLEIVNMQPIEALQAVSKGDVEYFVWGELSLQWFMRDYSFDNLEVYPVTYPKGEIHILAHDEALMKKMNAAYMRLSQTGKIQKIRSKWLSSDTESVGTARLVMMLIVVFALLALLLFLLSRLGLLYIRRKNKQRHELNELLTQAINTKYHTVVMNVKTRHAVNNYGSILPSEGMSLDEMARRTHPDDLENITAPALRALLNGEKDFDEYIYRFNFGTDEKPEWKELHTVATVERNGNGEMENIFFTDYDMTDEVKRRRDLQEKSRELQQVFKESIVGQAYYDKTGKCIDYNKRMDEILSPVYDLEERRKRNFFDLSVIRQIRDRGDLTPVYCCFRAKHRDGSGKWSYLEVRTSPVYDEQGELLFIGIVVVDLTETRNTYMESALRKKTIRQTNSKLELYSEEFSYLFKFGKMLIWQLDATADNYIIQQDFSGHTRHVPLADFATRVLPDTAKEWAEMEQQLKGDSTESITTLIHLSRGALRDSETWVAVSAMPIISAEGKKENYIGLMRDVTDLIHSEEALRIETERARQSEATKSIFLANMSHEIRTPLNSIVGFSDLLEQVDEKERKTFIDIIKRNCDMLLRLINDILDLSTLDTGQLQMHPEKVDFSQKFDEICMEMPGRISAPDVKFISDNPYTDFVTTVDVGRIQQIITNFVTNASKYTTHGHIKVGYSYRSLQTEERGLYVYCEDTGTGIPKDKCGQIFDRFVKLNDFVQGTGLGLSICKAIIERCNGRIGVDSEVGKGSTFWFWIPCERMA